MKDITAEELIYTDNTVPVDVRAPIEFEEGSIPFAINIPLFTNEEREEIGTLYKRMGQAAARWRAMEIVSPKLPDILNRLKECKLSGKEPVIFCWRGGMRSFSVASFLEYAGIPAIRLKGGYRAYRQFILEKMESVYPNKAIVIHGMTGVGKTEILMKLEKKGYPVLNLEKLSNHRGSIFGSIGIDKSNNQKKFDALLFHSLIQLKNEPYFIMEAESKRIGRIVQPIELLEKKQDGIHINIVSEMSIRVNRIYNDYVLAYEDESWFQTQVLNSYEKIEKRIKNLEIRSKIRTNIINKYYKDAIELLLSYYYDPMYDHKLSNYNGPFHEIQINSTDEAVREIEKMINNLM